jgi:HK97 family phage major capsid protein
MVDNEVKSAIESLGKTFEAFKETHQQELKEIKSKGSADPLTSDKLSKIEKDLDKLEDVNQKVTKQKLAQDETAERVKRVETMMSRPEFGTAYKNAESCEKKVFDKWLRQGKEALAPEEVKVLTASNDNTAGYLAPPEYVQELIKGIVEISPIRSIARVRSTTNRSVQIPRRTSTFAASFVAEQGSRTETTGYQVGMEEIPTHELYALVDISEQELEDSVFNLEQEMTQEFTEQFAKAEGNAFVSGSSVGKPEGIVTNSSVGVTASGVSATINANSLITLYHAVKPDYSRNGTFVMNRATLAAIRKLQDGSGQYVFQAGFSLQVGVPNTILGAPYVEATDVADLGSSAKAVYFGDFRRGYLVVDRVQMSVMRDPFTQATSGNVRYIARRRIGGQVILPEAIQILQCGS